jgi:hypothetical protein
LGSSFLYGGEGGGWGNVRDARELNMYGIDEKRNPNTEYMALEIEKDQNRLFFARGVKFTTLEPLFSMVEKVEDGGMLGMHVS